MATSTETTHAAVPAEQWQAGNYEHALAHLDQIQAQVGSILTPHSLATIWSDTYHQIDTLRSTLPNLVAPLMTPQTNKAQMFAEIRKTAITSTDGLKQLRDDFTSEQTRDMFARARESEAKDGDLSKGRGIRTVTNEENETS